MAMTGVLRPGYIQIRVLDMDAAVTHYVDRIGLNMVSRGNDGRVYLKGWDEFDRHSIILRQADSPGMDFAGFKVADAELRQVAAIALVDLFHREVAVFDVVITKL